MGFAIFGDDTFGYDLHDAAVYGLHVLLHQSFQIPVAWGDSATARRPCGNDDFLQLFVAGTYSSVRFLSDDFAEFV
jgi:hypothetical protein